MRHLVRLLLLLLVTGASAVPEKKVIDGVTYHLLKARPADVRILWKGAQDRQIRTFPEAHVFLTSRGESPDTIMNGGIYEPGGIPSGLLIQDGREFRPVNRNPGKGNFFLKPNGIFLIGSNGAAVIATEEFPPADAKIIHAVQSGPLLLRNGKVHREFRAASSSRLHRNGVGVTKDGDVVFAMSERNSPKLPNFHEFAVLFRDLGCNDALFLDGTICQMRHGATLLEPSNHFGSFIAVVANKQ